MFHRSLDGLAVERGRAPLPRNSRAVAALLEHLLDTDPDGGVVAGAGEDLAGFAISHRRGDAWFLSFLFVAPGAQRRGLGRALLRACLPADPAVRRATCAEADQPVATGLYASEGMAPRLPVFLLTGHPDRDALPACPRELSVAPLRADLAASIDRAVLGYEHPADHAMLVATGREGIVLRARDGRVRGYGYAQASGRLGPVAAHDPQDLPLLLGCLLDRVVALGARQAVVPGTAGAALRALIGAGMRIDGTPALYCASAPGPALERYLPMSFALL